MKKVIENSKENIINEEKAVSANNEAHENAQKINEAISNEIAVKKTSLDALESKEELPDEPEELEKVLVKEVKKKRVFDKSSWQPKTILGKNVKSGEISSFDAILDEGIKILEPEITDILLPNLETDLLLVGQSKGKFGGGQRRVFKQTQKKTQEGNKPKFATVAVVGDKNGYVGIGYGKAKETVPAREKSIRNAKLSVIKIRRGCGSWECGCKEPHSMPFRVRGKCGSVIIDLIPAPKGTGLKVEGECRKILALAGIKDAWSKTEGQTTSKINLITACFIALKNLLWTKVASKNFESLGIVEGAITDKNVSIKD